MGDTNPQHLYTPEALEACEKALRTILTKIGPWGGKLILIGGMADFGILKWPTSAV
jgi:hypothetical protein